MSKATRLYQITQMLDNRHAVSRQELEERLGVSWATLKRDITMMRDELHAPIKHCRERGGYYFDRITPQIGPKFELPGLWFSAEEIHALLTMQQLLTHLDQGGLLGPHIQPLMTRLTSILHDKDTNPDDVQKRIRVLSLAARQFKLDHFQAVASALLRRKRLNIRYRSRSSDETTVREVSPQRLVHYRDNWYLDGWCHLRNDLRSFSVDSFIAAEILSTEAKAVAESRLDRVLGNGYGIFSGETVKWATLIFTPARSRWVKDEKWHPKQQGRWLEDGSYELKVPYANDQELLMDILRNVRDCKVAAPEELAQRVREEVRAIAARYC